MFTQYNNGCIVCAMINSNQARNLYLLKENINFKKSHNMENVIEKLNNIFCLISQWEYLGGDCSNMFNKSVVDMFDDYVKARKHSTDDNYQELIDVLHEVNKGKKFTECLGNISIDNIMSTKDIGFNKFFANLPSECVLKTETNHYVAYVHGNIIDSLSMTTFSPTLKMFKEWSRKGFNKSYTLVKINTPCKK